MRLFLTILCSLPVVLAQVQYKVGLIEVFGNQKYSSADIQKSTRLKPGDTLSEEDFTTPRILLRIKVLRGVADASVELVCCDNKTQGVIVYVGVSETDKPRFPFHAAPTGTDSLPEVIRKTGIALQAALEKAVARGMTAEDTAAPYALSMDTATRHLQLQFVSYAHQYKDLLPMVLRYSADSAQRALATQVIAYGDDRAAIIPHLLHAVYDADEAVRNNATRALWVMQNWFIRHPDQKLTIPSAPFVPMLNSLIWTDRNKAVLMLNALTFDGPPALLATLKRECLPSLMQMAQWKNDGHAMGAYIILGRIAGYKEQAIYEAFFSEKRVAFLEEINLKLRPH